MARPGLGERRKAQTRREIAEAALELFARDGYDAVGVSAIAEHAGVSLRTFYYYFPTKDDVLSPISRDSIGDFVSLVAARPVEEDLATAVRRALDQVPAPVHPDGPRVLMRQILGVSALRARWLDDLRTLESALAPVVRQRAAQQVRGAASSAEPAAPTDEQAQLTAAAVVTALRVALETSSRDDADGDLAAALGRCLDHLQSGGGLGDAPGCDPDA
jgi:AcrR family transcriptional regulator